MWMVTDLDFGRSLYAKGYLKDGRMAWITVRVRELCSLAFAAHLGTR